MTVASANTCDAVRPASDPLIRVPSLVHETVGVVVVGVVVVGVVVLGLVGAEPPPPHAVVRQTKQRMPRRRIDMARLDRRRQLAVTGLAGTSLALTAFRPLTDAQFGVPLGNFDRRRIAMRRFVMVAIGTVMTLLAAQSASAQDVGVRAGVSGEPDQFYVGVHLLTPHVFDQVHFRPNVELGFGQDQRLLALNLDLVYRAPIRRSDWAVLAGGGPGANVFMRDRNGDTLTNTGGGLNVLLGLEHAKGFFTELKVGLIDSPSIKFGIGMTFK